VHDYASQGKASGKVSSRKMSHRKHTKTSVNSYRLNSTLNKKTASFRRDKAKHSEHGASILDAQVSHSESHDGGATPNTNPGLVETVVVSIQ
jgi:hypothetical protein